MNLYSNMNPPPIRKEILSSKSNTETVGYIPINRQIENMVLAGHRLAGFRQGMYDDTDDINPLRAPGLDFADVLNVAREVGRRMGESKRKAIKEKQEKALKEKEGAVASSGGSAEGGGAT